MFIEYVNRTFYINIRYKNKTKNDYIDIYIFYSKSIKYYNFLFYRMKKENFSLFKVFLTE